MSAINVGNIIRMHCYLVFSAEGFQRMAKRDQPSLKPGERQIKVNLDVPKSLFQTPQFAAKIMISDDDDNRSVTIDIPVTTEAEIAFFADQIAKTIAPAVNSDDEKHAGADDAEA